VFVAILAMGLFVMAARNVVDPDVWWHLRTGQLMVETHLVPHSDPYSFTRAGQPWVDHEWLSQVFIYGVYRFAGWGGLTAAFALVIAAALWIAFLRCPGKPYIAGLFTICGALACLPSAGVRPQMLTLLLASVLLWILERSYERPRLLWWTAPLVLLWVNVHAGFALGIVFLFLFLAGDLLDSALHRSESSQLLAHARKLALAIVVCVAVVPLNPNGLQLYRYPLETLRSPAMQGYISEWASPNFHQAEYAPTLLLILSILLFGALSPRRLRVRELLLLCAMTYAALRSVRHIPVFVLVVTPILAALANEWLKQRPVPIWTSGQGSPSRVKLALNASLLAGFIAFVAIRFVYVVKHQTEAEQQKYPSQAVAFLLSNPSCAPILNDYNWGGYLIWKAYPEYRVFIDGRADLYGDSFMDAFASTYYVRGKSWAAPLEQWSIRSVVLPPDAPLLTALDSTPGWKRVYSDSQAVILRKTP
jgi:hypothetical protein